MNHGRACEIHGLFQVNISEFSSSASSPVAMLQLYKSCLIQPDLNEANLLLGMDYQGVHLEPGNGNAHEQFPSLISETPKIMIRSVVRA